MQNINCMCESSLNVEKSTYLQAPHFLNVLRERKSKNFKFIIDIAQPRSASYPVRKETGSLSQHGSGITGDCGPCSTLLRIHGNG